MRYSRHCLVVGVTILFALGALADDRAESTATRSEVFPLTAGVEIGVLFAQPLSKLGVSFTPMIEIGYLLPVLEQRIEIFWDMSYTLPEYTSKSEQDPRIDSESYGYTIVEHQLMTSLGGLARLYPPGTPWNFYGQLGLRVSMQLSDVTGDAEGPEFGKNEETETSVGMMIAVGTEYQLGPGAIAAELDFYVTDLSHRVTGDTNAGGITIQLGYHFLF